MRYAAPKMENDLMRFPFDPSASGGKKFSAISALKYPNSEKSYLREQPF
jgi:hypothetical protein